MPIYDHYHGKNSNYLDIEYDDSTNKMKYDMKVKVGFYERDEEGSFRNYVTYRVQGDTVRDCLDEALNIQRPLVWGQNVWIAGYEFVTPATL